MTSLRALFLCAAVLASPMAAPAMAQTGPQTDLLERARSGDSEAQVALADQLRTGDGLPQNFAESAKWYARAAESGDPAALNRLGQMRFAGLGVAQDHALALDLLSRAAASGDARMIHDLAQALDSAPGDLADHARAVQLYRQAAGLGFEESAVSLAALLIEGRGTAADPDQARRLLEPIAARGHPKAANNLALLFVRGDGVEQDYARAAELFRIAADAGMPEAIRNLGVLYENGFGVPQSDEEAASLYRLAASLVSPEPAKTLPPLYDPHLIPFTGSQDELDHIMARAETGDPVAISTAGMAILAVQNDFSAHAEAARWFRRAAEAGHGYSMANLGVLYFRGSGVLQDYVLGYMWLSLAKAAQVEEAAAMMEIALPRMTPAQVADAQARAAALWQKWHP
ncbi:SEL1-like repeat protein [Ruegeria marina]|uniref:TPR repeat n=1 Tax=Ruegeria marina TaxID=639004 RepID=A0A1G7CEM4_9RHOB|nr:tetratricopeptide repeat protein [Ruegeria marina]SDE37713.1 hypothetical protein SAMN04488239_11818 [Ruegeria marina]